MSLLVDPRIGSGEFVRPLRKQGVPAKLKQIQFGDFAFTGYGPNGLIRVGIERKKVDELLGCVTDSRFTGTQIPGLLNTYDHAWLLVEGAYVPDVDDIILKGRAFQSKRGAVPMIAFHEAGFGRSRHLYSNFTKFQITVQVKARLYRERTLSAPESVQWIAALYRWYQKPWAQHKSVYTIDETRPEQAILDVRTLKRRLAAQLPGVAWSRSKQVDQYFPSVAAMFSAGELEWREALGVAKGRKLAKSIVTSIREMKGR